MYLGLQLLTGSSDHPVNSSELLSSVNISVLLQVSGAKFAHRAISRITPRWVLPTTLLIGVRTFLGEPDLTLVSTR